MSLARSIANSSRTASRSSILRSSVERTTALTRSQRRHASSGEGAAGVGGPVVIVGAVAGLAGLIYAFMPNMSGKESPTATGGFPDQKGSSNSKASSESKGGPASGSSGVSSSGGSAKEKHEEAVKQTRSGDKDNGGKGTATRG